MAINFRKSGTGPPLILIHGFPMNRQVWDGFVPLLENQFTVYTPDLPGFGSSEILTGDFSIADVASAMNRWVTEERIASPVLIGHSLGGYVALEMVRAEPAKYPALILFHSTAYADSSEKKESRTKVLQFIDENGVRAFTSNFIQPLFSDPSHPAIGHVRDLSVEADAPAVKGYTKAMRDRRDNTQVLADFPNPIMLLGGESDKGIPAESLKEQARLNSRIAVSILPGTGHMAMFEDRDAAVKQITGFLSGFITSSTGR